MIDIMNTDEARHWLHLFCEGLTTTDVIAERFGVEVSEVFEMWAAVQHDNNEAARNCGELLVGRPDDGKGDEEGGDAADASTSSEASTIRVEKPVWDSERPRSDDVGYVEPLGEGSGQHDDEVEHVGAGTSDAGACEENNEMDIEGTGEESRGACSSKNDGADKSEVNAKGDRGCLVHEGQQSEEVNTEELPTAGLASRPGAGSDERDTEGGEGGCEGDCEQRGEEDALDPLTGIPLRWAQFWRGVNADRSLGVGIPDPNEGHSMPISDGCDTMPGNHVEPTQADDADEMVGEAAGVGHGAASSAAGVSGTLGTEEPTSSTTELSRGVGSRQTDLKAWLKGPP